MADQVVAYIQELEDGADNAADRTIPSWTPVSGRVYYIGMHLIVNTGTPDVPTLSGNGITWSRFVNTTFNGNLDRMCVFSGVADDSSFAGTTIIQMGGTTIHRTVLAQVIESSNTDLIDPVQFSNSDGSSSGTAASITLTDFASSALLGFISITGAQTITPGASMTAELRESLVDGKKFESAWRQNPSDGVLAWTLGSSIAWRVAGITLRDRDATPPTIVSVTGVSSAAVVGLVAVGLSSGANTVFVIGVTATCRVSFVTVRTSVDTIIPVTGVAIVGTVDARVTNVIVDVVPDGVFSVCAVTVPNLSKDATPTIVGVQSQCRVGSVTITASGNATVGVTGVASAAVVGTITIAADRLVLVFGVGATFFCGTVTVSGSTATQTSIAAKTWATIHPTYRVTSRILK